MPDAGEIVAAIAPVVMVPATFEIRAGDRIVHLQPRCFWVAVALIGSAPEVRYPGELFDAVFSPYDDGGPLEAGRVIRRYVYTMRPLLRFLGIEIETIGVRGNAGYRVRINV